MNHVKKTSSWQKTYNMAFVITIVSLLLGTMVISLSKGFRQFEENFPSKQAFIENYNRVKLKLGDRVFPTVLVGKDGWMDYTGGENLDDFQNVNRFSDGFLRELGQVVNACHQYAQEKGFTFLVVVAPNKASIYPDKLPDGIEPIGAVSRLDQMNAYLRAEGLPEFLDLRPALRDARTTHDVYYKTNTHWNGYGAYTAYHEIMNSLSGDSPSLFPYPEKFFRIRVKNPTIHDLTKSIQANYLLEPAIAPTRTFDGQFQLLDFHGQTHVVSLNPESELPTLLMSHDSFGNSLKPFIFFNFREEYFYYRAESEIFLSRDLIMQYNPDFVIYEIVERNLGSVPDELKGCMP